MVSTTAFHLALIDEAVELLQTLEFRKPGMFTNAVLLHPEITTLIRDADEHERALYRLNPHNKMERIDGGRVYESSHTHAADPREDEELLIAADNAPYNTYVQTQLHDQPYTPLTRPRGATVLIPRLRPHQAPGVARTLYSRDSENPEEGFAGLCATVEALVARYPVEGVSKKVREFRRAHTALLGEISRHEALVEHQRERLNGFNDVEDEAGDEDNGNEPDSATIDALIRREEQEIRLLERQLLAHAR